MNKFSNRTAPSSQSISRLSESTRKASQSESVSTKSKMQELDYSNSDVYRESSDDAEDEDEDDEAFDAQNSKRKDHPMDISEDDYSDESDGCDEEISPETQQEIDQFMQSFRQLDLHFKIVGKTGEGTFSSVYKAIDLRYDRYINDWDLDDRNAEYHSPPTKRQRVTNPQGKRVKYVAIKKIYVTSSPQRIHNELELLKDLTGSKNVVSLITAFRHLDQVIAVMPFFRHVDFRDYFRKLEISDIQLYMRSLFTALKFVHAKGILHRDIKPTNFLYDCRKGRGVLVDFGLAEREAEDGSCVCLSSSSNGRKELKQNAGGYPKNDPRSSKRANRAGTRGFRAPEVLFKCNAQTTKIDVWSAGVILLTFLSKRFPFFNSPDDIDAIIEMATVFGKVKMRSCAALHGATFETTIPTISDRGHSLSRIVEWATTRDKGMPFTDEEESAIHFLEKTLELDHHKRLSAEKALKHPFLSNINADVSDDEVEAV